MFTFQRVSAKQLHSNQCFLFFCCCKGQKTDRIDSAAADDQKMSTLFSVYKACDTINPHQHSPVLGEGLPLRGHPRLEERLHEGLCEEALPEQSACKLGGTGITADVLAGGARPAILWCCVRGSLHAENEWFQQLACCVSGD